MTTGHATPGDNGGGPVRIRVNAKLNLGLVVGGARTDGYHPLSSVFQSIALSDTLELAVAGRDLVTSWDGGDVVDDEDNLAWRAVTSLRAAAAADRPIRLRIDKRIPVAAGLGGGSADAAGALWATQRLLGADPLLVSRLAPDLGSDVPFCVVGGTAVVAGRGDEVLPIPPRTGYAVGLVVPPVEVATPQVFRAWDEMGGPRGPEMAVSAVPAVISDLGPLRNDLYPAAVWIAPEIDDWRRRLETLWGRPVTMSGSGPSLYGFFEDVASAANAVAGAPTGSRLAVAVEPVAEGWLWQ